MTEIKKGKLLWGKLPNEHIPGVLDGEGVLGVGDEHCAVHRAPLAWNLLLEVKRTLSDCEAVTEGALS